MQRVKMEDWICAEEGLPCLTRENLRQLQLEKLNLLLGKLKLRGALYKELPDSLNSLEELENLPFTTAEMLSLHPENYLSCSQSQVSRVISQATSGTTGGSKRVFYSDKDLRRTVGFFASGISEMLSAGEKCLIAFPFSGPSGLGDLIAQAVIKLGAVPVKSGFGLSYTELIEIIRREKPETYIGFPVPLLSVMRLYDGDFPIKRALISGDSCPDGVCRALKEKLTLYPHYGSRETALGGAVTCQAFEGMHLRENHIIAEIIDENGSVLPDGSWGELVITTIGLEAMPLLRYRTGDISRIIPEPCPCGGVTKRLQQVRRRESCPVSIEKLDSELFSLPQIIDYSVYYNPRLHFEFNIKGSCPNIKEIINGIYPNLPFEVEIRESELDSRPAYPGKRHIITDHRK